jgi:protein gp37
MSDGTKIEWADATWNCITGCTKVSPGCDHCYAETFAERWRGIPGHHFEQGFDIRLWPERLNIPRQWKRPRRIFVNSMSDCFHEAVPDSFLDSMFAVMADCPQHVFQVLTKRHGRMRSYLARTWPEPLPNVWLGVSAEDQKRADLRIPALLETPAAVRFVSAEPLLGPVDLRPWLPVPQGAFCEAHWSWLCGNDVNGGECRRTRLSWIVAGGESGPKARPMRPEWARSLRDQCQATRTSFLFKQWGSHRWVAGNRWDEATQCWVDHGIVPQRVSKKLAGRVLDGRTWDEFPAAAGLAGAA